MKTLKQLKNDEVVLFLPQEKKWLHFTKPCKVFCVYEYDQVQPVLHSIDYLLEQKNAYAAGFISYEAAPAFDPALKVKKSSRVPLLWFGIYTWCEKVSLPKQIADDPVLEWKTEINEPAYCTALHHIKKYIESGETYQVNYSYRMQASLQKDPWNFFLSRVFHAKAPYAAYIQTADFSVCSLSPELFFSRNGRDILFKPMKGTAPRAGEYSADLKQADWLRHSEKNRAENVMIVDMIRHDIGRVATPGSIEVPTLFEVEKYPTVWQMTSTVTAQTTVSMTDLWTAVFPAASITGAPKCHTMEIIAQLEETPRGIYTGSIGYMAPKGHAQFNVAIRTVMIDHETSLAEYGTGGGIVWDSDADEEYREAKTKTLMLTDSTPSFQLLESILWTRENGFSLLDYHLKRLVETGDYFDYPIFLKKIHASLNEAVSSLEDASCKIRLLVNAAGDVSVESSRIESCFFRTKPRVRLAGKPVNTQTPFIYHKTDHRALYEEQLACHPRMDDVILWNERDEITESCYSNIALEMKGILYTPPVTCGLLAGTYRQWMLDQKSLQERVLHRDDLARADKIMLMNSVRGLREAKYFP